MPSMVNVSAFLGRPNVSRLAEAYGRLVAIEIAVKESLGQPSAKNRGHDVPMLLIELANCRDLPPHSIPKGPMISLAQSLSNLINSLYCNDRTGVATNVPRDNYPYMRYVRHAADMWPSPNTDEPVIEQLNSKAVDIIRLLSSTYRMPV